VLVLYGGPGYDVKLLLYLGKPVTAPWQKATGNTAVGPTLPKNNHGETKGGTGPWSPTPMSTALRRRRLCVEFILPLT